MNNSKTLILRCKRRRLLTQFVNGFKNFSRMVQPGLALILSLLILANAVNIPHMIILPAIPAWIAICLARAAYCRERWNIPKWRLPAYLDRHSGANGALMRFFETGAGTVPGEALKLRFPRIFPRQAMALWLLMLSGYVAWYLMPVRAAENTLAPTAYTPLPVQQTQDLVAGLAEHRPENDPFVQSAEDTLEKLRKRATGLEREDFTALEMLQEQAAEQLTREMAKLGDADELMNDFENMIAEFDQQNSLNNLQSMDLQEALQRLGELPPGMGTEQLKQLLSELESKSGQNSRQGQAQQGEAFARADIESLKAQIKEYRAQLGQQQAQACAVINKAGKGGISRGPGSSPLKYDHLAFQRENATLAPHTFRSNPDEKNTVVLAQGMTKRAEQGTSDPQTLGGRNFQAGTDTPYWRKRTLPRHRSVLEHYFGNADAE
ncbi:MAG: hypothetical protein GY862_22105 [Gammaproteobacteria bacterium]|nr:hypothetical protein [Gammaproteobacteria bacterium]